MRESSFEDSEESSIDNRDSDEDFESFDRDDVDLNYRDEEGNTDLHLSVGKLRFAFFEFESIWQHIINLVVKGPNLTNIQNNQLQTPLHLVCLQYQQNQIWALGPQGLELIKIFVENNSDPNIQDKQGNTALHYLCSCKVSTEFSFNLVQYLLANNADPTICNKNGKTPKNLIDVKGSQLNDFDIQIDNELIQQAKLKNNQIDNDSIQMIENNQLEMIKSKAHYSHYDTNKINFITNWFTFQTLFKKHIKIKLESKPRLSENLYFLEEILTESEPIYKETKHSGSVFNSYDFDGKIYSKQNLNAFNKSYQPGISLKSDDERGDLLFISTAPLKSDKSLDSKSFVVIDLIQLEKIARSEGWYKVLEQKCYFRLFDPHCVGKKIKYQFILNDNIFIELSAETAVFYKKNQILESIDLAPTCFIYHGFSGISYFVKSFICRLVDLLEDKLLKNEIYEYLKNLTKEELTDIIDDWSKKFEYVEINFFRELFLDWRYIKQIKIKNGAVDVQTIYDTIKGKQLASLDTVLKEHILVEQLPFLKKQIENFFTETPVIMDQKKLLENICVMVKILTRAGLENENHYAISMSEEKLFINLILNQDVRDRNGLQYDAERLLCVALTGYYQEYNPNRIKNYQDSFEIAIDFSERKINANGKPYNTELNSLEKVLACFIKTIVQLAFSGHFFRNFDENILPLKENQPAVSYLNAWHGLLEKLPSGNFKIRIVQDKLSFYFDNKQNLIYCKKIFLNAFSLNEKDLLINENSLTFALSLNDFIKKIDQSAIQYLAINLIDEESGELLILQRQHNYNSGIQQVGLYCGTGGSAPFPHDSLASTVALISWKLGIERSTLRKIFDNTLPQLMSKQNDFASYSCFISHQLMELIKQGKSIDKNFYHPGRVQAMSIFDVIEIKEQHPFLKQQVRAILIFFQQRLADSFKRSNCLIYIDEKFVKKVDVKLLLKYDELVIKLTPVCGDVDLKKFKEKIQVLWKLQVPQINIDNNSCWVKSVDPIKLCLDFKLFKVKDESSIISSKLLAMSSIFSHKKLNCEEIKKNLKRYKLDHK